MYPITGFLIIAKIVNDPQRGQMFIEMQNPTPKRDPGGVKQFAALAFLQTRKRFEFCPNGA